MPNRTQKPLVWVTGAGGLIGHALTQLAPECVPDYAVLGLTRDQLDITDESALRATFARRPPQLIIHCAALSRSPACQANPELAWRVNVDATRHLAELAQAIPMVFFSSDLVFDGRQGHYTEEDPVNPLSVYAETKVAAEQIVLANPRHTVLRTSLNGGVSPTRDHAFNEELRRAWQAGKIVRLFIDEFRSPLPAVVTARVVWALAKIGQTGRVHVAGRERLSRWEIGQLVVARWPQLRPQIEPGSLKDYDGPPRSPDTSLDCARAQRLLPFPLPGLKQWLQDHPNAEF
jgi:dTDP-4-dehydrorhamnose reductase